jgi:hypothetical protein
MIMIWNNDMATGMNRTRVDIDLNYYIIIVVVLSIWRI